MRIIKNIIHNYYFRIIRKILKEQKFRQVKRDLRKLIKRSELLQTKPWLVKPSNDDYEGVPI